jgi:hypothetical protein
MTSHVQPPPSAELFATALIADRELREEVLGDLTEEYHHLSASASPPPATRWYWSQLLRSAIPLSTMAVSRGGRRGWTRHLFAVLAGSATMYVILTLGAILNGRLRGVILNPVSPWASQALSFGDPLFGTLPPLWLTAATSVVVAVLAGIVSSYVAASVGRRSPLAPAMTLCAICIGLLYVLPLLIGVVVGMRDASAAASGQLWRLGWMLVGVMAGVLLKARMLRAAAA